MFGTLFKNCAKMHPLFRVNYSSEQWATMTSKTTPDAKPKKPKASKIPTGWRSMRSAPRDGTIILVCETPNGEHWNVMAASYQMHMGHPLMEGFWGVWTTSRLPAHLNDEREDGARERGLPVDYRAIAMTPLCWQPMPMCEPVEKLRRRAAQVYAAKAREREAVSAP